MDDKKAMRVMSVRLDLDRAAVDHLRDVAAIAARCGNEVLNRCYADAMKYRQMLYALPEADRTKEREKEISRAAKTRYPVSVENWDPLSGNLRDTMKSEAGDRWKRFAKAVLAGHDTLPLFASDRSLRLRDKAVRLVRDGDWYALELQLYPGRQDNWFRAPIYKFTEKKKLYVEEWLQRVSDGEIAIKRTSIVFHKRRRNLVRARLAYSKDLSQPVLGSHTAHIGPVGENGELYLRVDGPAYSFEDHRRLRSLTRQVQRMQQMKGYFEGRFLRLRESQKPANLRRYRNFEEWAADEPCHKLSRSIVDFCAAKSVRELVWEIEHDGALPWHRLHFQVKYKAEEVGMSVADPAPLVDQVRKGEKRQWAIQQKKAMRELKKAGKAALQS